MPYDIVMDYSLTILFFLLSVAFPRWHLPASGEETQIISSVALDAKPIILLPLS